MSKAESGNYLTTTKHILTGKESVNPFTGYSESRLTLEDGFKDLSLDERFTALKEALTGRTSPIRSHGESELRTVGAVPGGLMFESNSAERSLVQNKVPLKDTEYFNRKSQRLSSMYQALLDEGFSPEEAERKIQYDKRQLAKMRDAQLLDQSEEDALNNRRFKDPLEKIQMIDALIARILRDKLDGWENRIIRLSEMLAEEKKALQPPAIGAGQLEQMMIRGGLDPLDPPPPPPVVDFTTHDLEQPARFIIKDLKGFEFNPETPFDGLRLPYESCLFVLGTELKAVVLATQEDEDVITLKLLSEQKSDIPWHASATLYVRLRNGKAQTRWIKTKRGMDKRLGMVTAVLGFLAGEQLDDVVVETVITAPERDVPPPKPGHCYNVVSITQGRKGKRRDWQGGTHASPREHVRRGYWWPGKNGPIWIKSTVVNKGVLGRVEKEYHVKKVEEAR